MASGGTRIVCGSVVGTGADLDVRTVGFRPALVEIVNVDSDDEGKWMEGMADASAFKRLKAGGSSVVTTGGITPLSDGFRLGSDADLNVSGELVRYVAHE